MNPKFLCPLALDLTGCMQLFLGFSRCNIVEKYEK